MRRVGLFRVHVVEADLGVNSHRTVYVLKQLFSKTVVSYWFTHVSSRVTTFRHAVFESKHVAEQVAECMNANIKYRGFEVRPTCYIGKDNKEHIAYFAANKEGCIRTDRLLESIGVVKNYIDLYYGKHKITADVKEKEV